MTTTNKGSLAFFRRLTNRRSVQEQCELCSAALPSDHEHLLEVGNRRFHCACRACAILFSHRGDSKYRRIPRDVTNLTDLTLSDLQWEAFGLPVGMAFFLNDSTIGRVVAVYPSPAGATQSNIPMDAWDEFVAENPDLRDLEPDVEALLVNRVHGSRDCFRVGVDQCYRLAGILRTYWRGFSGGSAMWDEIGRFFAELKGRSGP